MLSALRVCIFSYFAASALGCSEVECEPTEYKAADTCFRRRDAGASADSSATPPADDVADAAVGRALDGASGPRGPVQYDASSTTEAAAPSEDAASVPADSALPSPEQDGAIASPGPACVASPESCDALDNDCDGVVDNGVKTRCWADEDGDGFAAVGATISEVCGECGSKRTAVEPAGVAKIDCDDTDKTRSPTVTDICGDRIDNDCDGTPDDDSNNACGGPCTTQLPGRPGETCSNGLRGACARSGKYECQSDGAMKCSAGPVTGSAETCDGVDNDCDGEVDEGAKNACGGCARLPNAPESACSAGAGACAAAGVFKCQGADAVACNATPAATPTWYPDCDGDGFGVTAGSVASCTAPTPPAGCMGYTRTVPMAGSTADCRDDNATYFPGQTKYVALAAGTSPSDFDVNCDGRIEVNQETAVANTGGPAHYNFCKVRPTCVGSCPSGAQDYPCEDIACVRVPLPFGQSLSDLQSCAPVQIARYWRISTGYCEAMLFPGSLRCR